MSENGAPVSCARSTAASWRCSSSAFDMPRSAATVGRRSCATPLIGSAGQARLRRGSDQRDVAPVDVEHEPVRALELDGVRIVAAHGGDHVVLVLVDGGLLAAQKDDAG